MIYEFDTSAAVFDRDDLRTLSVSYERALGRLEVSRIMDAGSREDLAKLIFHLGRDRLLKGANLRARGAEADIADEASGFLNEMHGVSLCA